MTRRPRFLHLLLLCLGLLLSQQGAWQHAAGHLAAQEQAMEGDGVGQGTRPEQRGHAHECSLCLAYSALDGALASSAQTPAADACMSPLVAFPGAPCAARTFLSFHSRAPPVPAA